MFTPLPAVKELMAAPCPRFLQPWHNQHSVLMWGPGQATRLPCPAWPTGVTASVTCRMVLNPDLEVGKAPVRPALASLQGDWTE